MGHNLQKITVLALHGFLGSGSDFDQLKNILPNTYDINAPNLFSGNEYDLDSFSALTKQLKNLVPAGSEKKIFIGYSLGGRIGLHLLKNDPNLFDRWVFLSTHPGLESIQEKNQRILSDQLWSDKLNQLSWAEFINEWNGQDVFAGSLEPDKSENQFNINQLGKAFLNLSLGQQADQSAVIQANQKKINWVVGSQDQKFLNLADTMKQKKILENYSRISSGHRILFDIKALQSLRGVLEQFRP